MLDATDSRAEERGPIPGRSRSAFHVLSLLNGWSLFVVGTLSLGISAYAGGWAGVIVSMALILHGTLEIVLSKRSVADDLKSCSRRMAINQIGLATSLSLYFAYQMSGLEPDVLIASLIESPLYDALLMYPEDLRLKLLDGLPKMLGVFYIVVAAVAWIFCGGTALYYWIQGR
ncbi:MAG: hypothetical protein CBC31_010635 [Verrucomicrobia bacterium TMED71]|nr:MAG: hypothetical protein CBC31_010635 [Verrucomicrobia bacterium TMED71]